MIKLGNSHNLREGEVHTDAKKFAISGVEPGTAEALAELSTASPRGQVSRASSEAYGNPRFRKMRAQGDALDDVTAHGPENSQVAGNERNSPRNCPETQKSRVCAESRRPLLCQTPGADRAGREEQKDMTNSWGDT